MFNKSTNEQKIDIPTLVMKRLLVLLGFLYLIAIPTGFLGDKRKLEPVDVGVLVVLLVVNSDLSLKDNLERLTSVKITPTSVEATLKEKVEQLSEEVAKQKDQNQVDAEAKSSVDLQLSETSSFSQNDLDNKIQKASYSAKETIYKMAKDARRNAHNKKGIIERTLPVFQALIDSGYKNDSYRFYAQLGYALKDQEQPDWKRAKDNLDTAIELWRQEHPKGALPSLYCFNWVICAATLDEPLTLQQPEIDERIEAATTCETLYKVIVNHPKYIDWVARHHGDKCTIHPKFDNLSGYCRKDYDEQGKQLSQV